MKSFTLHGAQVYDPEENRFLTKDVFISGGKICAEPEPDARTLDVSGCLLTTGLIDFHVHYFNHGTENGVNPDACSFPCGITTAVDAGSCGAGNVEAFLHGAAAQSDVTIYAQLLTASGGQTTDRYPEHAEVRYLEHERIRELFERYPETLKGLKLRLSRNVLAPEEARALLQETLRLAQTLGCAVCVHITNPVLPLSEIADALRPGDILCHIYQGRGETILDEGGTLRPAIRRAHERGVLLDGCNGSGNFDLEVCRAALRQGLYPDIISSDMNSSGAFLQPLYSLPRIMSKYLDLGMPLDAVLHAATAAPAQAIGHGELASLRPGTPADLAVFRLLRKPMSYTDAAGHVLSGGQALVPQLTMKRGQVVYCQSDFL